MDPRGHTVRRRSVRSRSLLAAAGLAALASAGACATLTAPTVGVCGNGVVDVGEDCDALAGETAEGYGCGKTGTSSQCRFVPNAEEQCPPQHHLGADGICRDATGAFEVKTTLEAEPLAVQLEESGVTVVARNGADLSVVSLDDQGNVQSRLTLPQLAKGFAPPLRDDLMGAGDVTDERPASRHISPLLPSGDLLIPLESRENEQIRASAIGLFRRDGDTFLTELQTGMPTVAGYPPVDGTKSPRLIRVPGPPGLSLANIGYLSVSLVPGDSGFLVCEPGATCGAVAGGDELVFTDYRVRQGDLVAYAREAQQPATLLPTILSVETDTGRLAFGSIVDSVGPGLQPSSYLLDPRLPIEDAYTALYCVDTSAACNASCNSELACLEHCNLGSEPPSGTFCDCTTPCAKACRPFLLDVPNCALCGGDPVCAADCSAATQCGTAYEIDQVLYAIAYPGGSAGPYGALLEFGAALLDGDGRRGFGRFFAHHSGKAPCEGACVPAPAHLSEVFFSEQGDRSELIESVASTGFADFSGDGLPDFVFSFEGELRLGLSFPGLSFPLGIDELLAVGDINDDGISDIVGRRQGFTAILLGGVTWPLVSFNYSLGNQAAEAVFSDLDGNGVEDVVVRTEAELGAPCSGGSIYVLFGNAQDNPSDPVAVGSGTCIVEMLPLKLESSGDGIGDVAVLRDEGGDFKIGTLLGDAQRVLTSPLSFAESSVQRLLPLSTGEGVVTTDGAIALVVVRSEQDTRVHEVTSLAGQLSSTEATLSGEPFLLNDEDSWAVGGSGRLVLWDATGAKLVSALGMGSYEAVPLGQLPPVAPTSKLLVPELNAGLALPEFVLVSFDLEAGSAEVHLVDASGGVETQSLASCYSDAASLLSPTDLELCGQIVDLSDPTAAARFSCTLFYGQPELGLAEADGVTTSFSFDLDGDGLFERLSGGAGELELQGEVCSSFGDEVTVGTKSGEGT